MKLDKEVLAKVQGPFMKAWNYVAADTMQMLQEQNVRPKNKELIEGVLDGGNYDLAAGKEAYDFMQELYKEHGFNKVVNWLNRNIKLV
jgi:hypothetical protein